MRTIEQFIDTHGIVAGLHRGDWRVARDQSYHEVVTLNNRAVFPRLRCYKQGLAWCEDMQGAKLLTRFENLRKWKGAVGSAPVAEVKHPDLDDGITVVEPTFKPSMTEDEMTQKILKSLGL